jgi:CubicO group peptidase (beta-lactamase class C family)
MPGPIFKTLSLDELTQQTALRSKPQGSNSTYLASVAVVAGVIIGLFFGIGFSLLVPEQIIRGSGMDNRGPEVKLHAQSVSSELERPPSPAVASHPSVALAKEPVVREGLTPENTNPAGGSVSAASEAVISTAAGAGSSTDAPAVGSMANAATLARPGTVSPTERASNFPVATPAIPPASRTIAAEIADLLARGDSFVVIGDIASARVFYQRAASAGDGRAALRMGTTFDPAFLLRARLPHAFGDPAEARSWYRRAFDLEEDKVKGRRNAVDTR